MNACIDMHVLNAGSKPGYALAGAFCSISSKMWGYHLTKILRMILELRACKLLLTIAWLFKHLVDHIHVKFLLIISRL